MGGLQKKVCVVLGPERLAIAHTASVHTWNSMSLDGCSALVLQSVKVGVLNGDD